MVKLGVGFYFRVGDLFVLYGFAWFVVEEGFERGVCFWVSVIGL